MKEELLLLRNQLKMGHRISFAEAMLQQKAIDILVNKAGNSPAICIDLASGPDRTVEVRYVAPPGYVMVPKVATEKMLIAGLEEADPLGSLIDWNASRGDCNTREQVQGMFEAMLAAAPQSPGGDHATVPGKWIPVSERMPEEGGRYWCYVEEQNSLGKSHYQWNCSWNGDVWSDKALTGRVTHWMPLPAAPQEVK